jgi:excisionase family DNA binding protein
VNSEPFVDLEAASAFLGVKPTWMYEAVRLGRVPSYKVGKFRRFRVSELEAWMASRHEGNGNADRLCAPQVDVGKSR